MLSKFECDKVEDGEGNEASIKGFAIKVSIFAVVLFGERRGKTV